MNDNHIADERKPIYQVLNVEDDTWSDTDWMNYQSMSCEKRIVYAAPTPERADAATAGAKPDDWSNKAIACSACRLTWGDCRLLSDVRSGRVAIVAPIAPRADADTAGASEDAPECNCNSYPTHREECRVTEYARRKFRESGESAAGASERAKYDPATQPGDPAYDGAEAYEARLEAMYPDAPERADAEKDAALTDEQIMNLWGESFWHGETYPEKALHFARAILAANGEKP